MPTDQVGTYWTVFEIAGNGRIRPINTILNTSLRHMKGVMIIELPYCGKEIKDDAAFCGFCGKQVPPKPLEEAAPSPPSDVIEKEVPKSSDNAPTEVVE